MKDLDKILIQGMGENYAINSGLIKKERKHPLKSIAESAKMRKFKRLYEENSKLKSTINNIIDFSKKK